MTVDEWGKKQNQDGGGGGEVGSQTGLPKGFPTLHDPRPRGPVTVVCQFDLAGAEAVVRQLVLPVESICNEMRWSVNSVDGWRASLCAKSYCKSRTAGSFGDCISGTQSSAESISLRNK